MLRGKKIYSEQFLYKILSKILFFIYIFIIDQLSKERDFNSIHAFLRIETREIKNLISKPISQNSLFRWYIFSFAN